MGSEWEVEMYSQVGSPGKGKRLSWVSVRMFDGTPEQALVVLKQVRATADPRVLAFRLVWRGR
jgi:hypothetical protein